jgi:hypothetical protein
VLRDLSKTMNSMMFTTRVIESDADLLEAINISKAIAGMRDLTVPLPSDLQFENASLAGLYGVLQRCWTHAGRITRDLNDAVQLHMALCSDAMRFLHYECFNVYSKRWALATAALLMNAMIVHASRRYDCTPDWVKLHDNVPLIKGQIGIARCPGNKNFRRGDAKFMASLEHVTYMPWEKQKTKTSNQQEEEKKKKKTDDSKSGATKTPCYRPASWTWNEELRTPSKAKAAAVLAPTTSTDGGDDESKKQKKKLQLQQAASFPNVSKSFIYRTSHESVSHLAFEVNMLRKSGVTHAVFCMGDHEFKSLGIDKALLCDALREHKIQSMFVHQATHVTLSMSSMFAMVKACMRALCTSAASRIVFISQEGLHRASSAIACVCCAFAMDSKQMPALVRETRGAASIGSLRFVEAFDKYWKQQLIQQLLENEARFALDAIASMEHDATAGNGSAGAGAGAGGSSSSSIAMKFA